MAYLRVLGINGLRSYLKENLDVFYFLRVGYKPITYK
jgi:hypothetical protein